MNPKEFMLRWIEGMKNLTTLQILEGKTWGHLGGMVGLIFATITMILYNTWYFTIFLIAMIYLQYLEWVASRKAYRNAIEMETIKNFKGEESEI